MGDASQPQMQRIYGTAFFTQEELDAWLKQREKPRSAIIVDWDGARSVFDPGTIRAGSRALAP